MDMFDFEFSRYLVRLRLTRPARFHFNHGGALMGVLRRATGIHNLPAGVAPFACESGRVGFDEGDFYHTGLTLAGAARRDVDIGHFGDELSRIGTRPLARDEPQPTLAGNFEVVAIDALLPPNLIK